jgi:molybdopterin molybdotransferase
VNDLLTPAAAEAIVLADPPHLATEHVPLEEATGRILAEDLVADRPHPPYDRVMMDGICFRAAEAGEEPVLAIAGVHAAGNANPPPLSPGHCW